MNEVVDILLATYNGEEYVAEQLETLLNQTHRDIRIIVGDDASRDTTPDIVLDYAKRYPQKIFFHQYLDNVGPILNFSRIAEFSEADYIMLSDQDDLWHLDKVEKTLAKMKEMEKVYGKETPLLVHTDLQVVDDKGQELYPSFWSYSQCLPTQSDFPRILTQNNVTGCTIMVNKPLLELAFPIPTEAYMHDHWINLVATVFGKVGYVPEATISYRQHGENWVGAVKHINLKDIFNLFFDKRKVIVSTRLLYAKIIQAYVFYKRFGHNLDEEAEETIRQFINLKNDSFYKEVKTRIHYNFYSSNRWKMIYEIVVSYMHGPIPDKYKIKV